MIQSIIFDLGGVYFTDGARIAIGKISHKFNLRPELVENALEFNTELGMLYRKGEITAEEFWDIAKKLLGIDADNNYLNRIWMNSYKPILGTIGIIKQLKKKGIKLFFLSDNVEERTEYLQAKYNFLENFIDGIFSYETHKMKSDGTDIFKLAIDKTGDKPEDIIFIDDKEEFVETAKKVGMKAIYFKNPEQLEEELKDIKVL